MLLREGWLLFSQLLGLLVADAHRLRLAVALGVEILALIFRRFVFLNGDPVLVGPGVLSDACDLPGNLHARLATRYLEAVALHLLRDVQVRSRRADRGQLVAELLIQRVKP